MNRDATTGLFLMGLAVVYYLGADALPISMLSDEIGAAGYPKLLAISLFVLSAILVLQGFFAGRRVKDPAKASEEKHAAFCAMVMVLIGIGYLVSVTWIGYPLAVGLMVAVVAYYQGQPISKKLVLTSVISAVFFWLFFVHALSIPLPSGIWPDLIQ